MSEPTKEEYAWLLEGRGSMKSEIVGLLWQMMNNDQASEDEKKWATELRRRFQVASVKPRLCRVCGHVETGACIKAMRENKPADQHILQDYTRLPNSDTELVDNMPATYISH